MKLKTASLALATIAALFAVLTAGMALRIGWLVMEEPDLAYEASGYFSTQGGPPMTRAELTELMSQMACHDKSTQLVERWKDRCGPHEIVDRTVVQAAREIGSLIGAPLTALGLGEAFASVIDYVQAQSLKRIEAQEASKTPKVQNVTRN